MEAAPPRIMRLRRRVHFILDSGVADNTARFVHAALVLLVIVSVGAVVLETVPDYWARFAPQFVAIEWLAAFIFTCEYALRLWSAPESPAWSDRGEWGARLAYARTPFAIIDLLMLAFRADYRNADELVRRYVLADDDTLEDDDE